jgi:hypothetical protein
MSGPRLESQSLPTGLQACLIQPIRLRGIGWEAADKAPFAMFVGLSWCRATPVPAIEGSTYLLNLLRFHPALHQYRVGRCWTSGIL